MIERNMIINPDHMSQRAVDDTLTLAEAHRLLRRDLAARLGGPGQLAALSGSSAGSRSPTPRPRPDFLEAYGKYRPKQTPYLLGWGYGADLGGLAAQPDRRRPRQRQLPVQVLRRQGHLRPPAHRRAHLRLHHRGRRPLRPLRRVVRGPPPPRRHAARATTCGTAPRRTSRCGSGPSGIRVAGCRPAAAA